MARPDVELPRPAAWKIALLALATLLVLWVVVAKLSSFGALLAAARAARPGPLLLALALTFLSLTLATLRWATVLRAMGHPIAFRTALAAVLGTWPPSVITPSRASDLLRAWALRGRVPTEVGLSSVVLERVVDVQTLCALGAAGLWSAGRATWAAAMASMVPALWAAVALLRRAGPALARLPLLGRRREKLDRLIGALQEARRRPREMTAVFALSLGSWLTALSMLAALLAAVEADVPFREIAAFWPAAIFVGLLPASFAGMGTRDAAFVLLLQAAGGAPDEGRVLAATLGYALMSTWLWAMVGLPWMVRLGLAGALISREAASTSPRDPEPR